MFARALLACLAVFFWVACQPQGHTTTGSAASSTAVAPRAPVATARVSASAMVSSSPSETCQRTSDCRVMARGCCPPCRDLNEQGETRYKPAVFSQAQLAERQRQCANKTLKCAKCSDSGLETSYLPQCVDQRCEMIDVRSSSMSACEVDADCVLRPPRCCGCKGQPVAVSMSGQALFRQTVCEAGVKCRACQIPNYEGLSAACVNGHCTRQGRWKRATP